MHVWRERRPQQRRLQPSNGRLIVSSNILAPLRWLYGLHRGSGSQLNLCASHDARACRGMQGSSTGAAVCGPQGFSIDPQPPPATRTTSTLSPGRVERRTASPLFLKQPSRFPFIHSYCIPHTLVKRRRPSCRWPETTKEAGRRPGKGEAGQGGSGSRCQWSPPVRPAHLTHCAFTWVKTWALRGQYTNCRHCRGGGVQAAVVAKYAIRSSSTLDLVLRLQNRRDTTGPAAQPPPPPAPPPPTHQRRLQQGEGQSRLGCKG